MRNERARIERERLEQERERNIQLRMEQKMRQRQMDAQNAELLSSINYEMNILLFYFCLL